MVQNLQRLEQRQDAEEVRALNGAGKYILAEPYQRFKVPSNEWYFWSESRRKDHVDKFRKYHPTFVTTFISQKMLEENHATSTEKK